MHKGPATRASVAGVCDDTAVDYDDVRDDEEQTGGGACSS